MFDILVYLHSNMVRFIMKQIFDEISSELKFTFQYG